MNLRTIPRAAIGGYVKAVRWPLDRAATMLGRDTLGLDRAEAARARGAGAVLGDEQLLRDAGRRRTAVTQRERAGELRAQADQRRRRPSASPARKQRAATPSAARSAARPRPRSKRRRSRIAPSASGSRRWRRSPRRWTSRRTR